MLVFVVPLQSRQASKDWPLVCQLAQRTLLSTLAQTHPDFRVFLVCNDVPEGCPTHPSLTVIERELPVLDMSVWENRMEDKGRKVRIGLVKARALAPCHIMLTDADDCVSKRLAAHVHAHPQSVGWCFDRGLLHDEGSRLIFKRLHDFDAVCGTSSIVRANIGSLPESENGPRSDNFVFHSGHTKIRSYMIGRGTPLEILPFDGAVYNLATGENNYGFSLRGWKSKKILLQKLLNYRLLTRRTREEFGLYDLIRP
jgi:hypothetical protein